MKTCHLILKIIKTLKRNILQYLCLFLFLRLDLQVRSFGSYSDMFAERNNQAMDSRNLAMELEVGFHRMCQHFYKFVRALVLLVQMVFHSQEWGQTLIVFPLLFEALTILIALLLFQEDHPHTLQAQHFHRLEIKENV